MSLWVDLLTTMSVSNGRMVARVRDRMKKEDEGGRMMDEARTSGNGRKKQEPQPQLISGQRASDRRAPTPALGVHAPVRQVPPFVAVAPPRGLFPRKTARPVSAGVAPLQR